MADLQIIVGRALTDPAFCEHLIADPEGVLAEHGVEADPDLVQTIRELDAEAIQRLAAAFGKDHAAG